LFGHKLPQDYAFLNLNPVFHRWNGFCIAIVVRLQRPAAERAMKIYLLMLLIGTLLTAIRFTSAPEARSETLPQQPVPHKA
jgi:hypothetical protein